MIEVKHSLALSLIGASLLLVGCDSTTISSDSLQSDPETDDSQTTVIPDDLLSGVNLADNSGFENGLDGWVEVEPAFTSEDTVLGVGSAKVEDNGSISQVIAVEPGTRYRVTGWIEGDGIIFVDIPGSTARESAMASGEGYDPIEFEFDTGTATTVTITGATTAGTGTVRFDELTVIKAGESANGGETETVINLADNGGFENGLDGWVEVEPAFTSEDTVLGVGSAKVEDNGSISQVIAVEPGTRYRVTGWIEGDGIVFVDIPGSTSVVSASAIGEGFDPFEFELDTGTAESITITGATTAGTGTVRFDELAVIRVGESTGGSDTGTGTGTGTNLTDNGGFEDGLAGWVEVEPASTSGDSVVGEGSAKVEDTGSISQVIAVEPGARYRVTGWIEGDGIVFVSIPGNTSGASAKGFGEGFDPIEFEFDTGTAESVTITGATSFGTGTVRFDALTVIKVGESANSGETETETETETTDEIAVKPADAVEVVLNGTFENDLEGWTELEPALTTAQAFEGNGGAKLNNSGSVSQRVFLEPSSIYRLTAWIEGDPTVSVLVDGRTVSVSGTDTLCTQCGNGTEFVPVTLEFETGNADFGEVSVTASASASDSRVDNVSVYKISNNPVVGPQPVDPNTVFDYSIWALEGDNPITRDGLLAFHALEQCVVTPNGNGCRHEQKIQTSARFGLTEQYERFSADINATLSPGSETIVAQHHPEGTGTLTALYLSDTSTPVEYPNVVNGVPNDGIFDVYVLIRNGLVDADGTVLNDAFILGTIESGDTFNFEVINDHGEITMTGLGRTGTVTSADSSNSFFKFGNYHQARDPVNRERIVLEKPLDDAAKPLFRAYYSSYNITESTLVFSDVYYERVIDEEVINP